MKERGDHQIGNQEMLAIVLALETVPREVLDGACVTLFCDNDGVLHSMIKGSSRCTETNQMIGRCWYQIMRRRIGLHLLRVQSKANIADLPSRKDFRMLKMVGATELEPVLPVWLDQIWEIPKFENF